MINYVDDGRVWCVYDVVDTSGATTLLTSTTGLSGMEIDGVAVTLAKTYTFATTGEHLVKFSLNNNVTSIAENQFNGVTRLKEVVAPAVITTIVQRAFKNCTSLTTIELPNVTTIGYEGFSGDTALTGELNLPSLTSFSGNGAVFYNTGITSIVSLGSLTDTRPQSFYGCTSLEFAILPSTITTLSQWVFRACTSLKRVTCHATTPPSFDRAFIDCTALSAIYVPAESVSAYRAASGWSSYASIIFPIYDSVPLNIAGLANGRWRRRLMMGASTPGKSYPDGAIPAEILFSDGYGGFVDSGIIPLASMSYEVYIRWGFNGTQYPFGYYISGVRYVPIGGTASSMEVQYGNYYTVSSSSRQNYSTYIHRISITKAGAVIETYDLERNLLATETVTFSGSDVSFSKTFGILGRKSGDSSSSSSYSGVGYMKVYGDSNFGSLVADLRPMYYQNGWGYWDAKNAVFKPATSTVFGFGSYWNSEGFMCSCFQNSTGSSYSLANRRWCAVSPYYEMPSSCSTVEIHLSSSASTNYQICFFNSSYSCTSNVNYSSVDKQVSVPSGTAYYRITVNPGAINDCYVYDVTNSEYIWKGINVQ